MHLLILGGSRDARLTAARRQVVAEDHFENHIALPAPMLPFIRPSAVHLPASPLLIRLDDAEQAFPNNQKTGTRLVLTQSTYLVQKWLDRLRPSDWVIATADRDALGRAAEEALQGRGPWRHFKVLEIGSENSPLTSEEVSRADHAGDPLPLGVSAPELDGALSTAFHSLSGAERLQICREAFARFPRAAAAALACASAFREQQDDRAAREALMRARELAPDWEAVHFEEGKFWLACEDLERAQAAFGRAAELMPSFSAAYTNWGGVLGELDRPAEALEAFTHALAGDPDNPMLLNNIGVVHREIGQLTESERALVRLTTIAPSFVFGHYNLGHTRFLEGDYSGALRAYEEGRRLDPDKNRRQGCRLALVRFAAGDAAGAERDLWESIETAPVEEREDLLLEAFEVVQAVLHVRPELAAHDAFLSRLTEEIRRL